VEVNPREVTIVTAGYAGHPKWSPVADLILFNPANDGLATLDLKSGIERVIFKKGVQNTAFSPDGNRVSFWSNFNVLAGLTTMDLSGQHLKTVYPTDHISEMKWSPDGTCIAFSCTNTHLGDEFVVLRIDSGEPEVLCKQSLQVTDFEWYPDSQSVCFTAGEHSFVWFADTNQVMLSPIPTYLFGMKDDDLTPSANRILSMQNGVQDVSFSQDQQWMLFTAIVSKDRQRIGWTRYVDGESFTNGLYLSQVRHMGTEIIYRATSFSDAITYPSLNFDGTKVLFTQPNSAHFLSLLWL